jgi:hypothetical protein
MEMPKEAWKHLWKITWRCQWMQEVRTETNQCLWRDARIVGTVVYLQPYTSPQTCSAPGDNHSLPPGCIVRGRP